IRPSRSTSKWMPPHETVLPRNASAQIVEMNRSLHGTSAIRSQMPTTPNTRLAISPPTALRIPTAVAQTCQPKTENPDATRKIVAQRVVCVTTYEKDEHGRAL